MIGTADKKITLKLAVNLVLKNENNYEGNSLPFTILLCYAILKNSKKKSFCSLFITKRDRNAP